MTTRERAMKILQTPLPKKFNNYMCEWARH